MTVSPTARHRHTSEDDRPAGAATVPHSMDYPPKDDPNHLELWRNALPEHQMARITSVCVPFRERRPRRRRHHQTRWVRSAMDPARQPTPSAAGEAAAGGSSDGASPHGLSSKI